MNILRSLVIPAALSAMLVAPVAVLAQQANQAPAPGAFGGAAQTHRHWHHHRGFLMRGVNLTAQQKAQIKQIREQFRQAHPRGSRPDRQAHQQLRTQIMNVLTPQQRAQVQQNIKEMRLRWQQRRAEHPSAQPTPAS